MAYDIVNFEPVYVDDKQSDNFGRWLESGENRYRDFMNAPHDNGEYYVMTTKIQHTTRYSRRVYVFYAVKKVIRKDYYFDENSDSEVAVMVYEDDCGKTRRYYHDEFSTSDRLFRFEHGKWNSRRKAHFMHTYGGYCTMPESLRTFMEEG